MGQNLAAFKNLPGEFKAFKSITQVRGFHRLRMIRGQTYVPRVQVLAWNSIFVKGSSGMRWTPTWRKKFKMFVVLIFIFSNLSPKSLSDLMRFYLSMFVIFDRSKKTLQFLLIMQKDNITLQSPMNSVWTKLFQPLLI